MSDKNRMNCLLPKRTKSSNKSDGGKVLIIGGGKGLYGAGILSSLAATRSGAGYTHLMTDLSRFPWIKFPDFIVHPIKISELKNKRDFSIGIGPGLGKEKSRIALLKYLIKNNYEKVTADADALTLIAENDIAPLPASWVLTPHEGELARLLQVKSSKVKANRKKAIELAVKKFKCTIVLKGSETLIYSPELKKISTVNSGTPALSKAGTGDVLLGIISAFRAQGLEPEQASILAAYVHGKAAEAYEIEGNDQLSLRPMDLIDKISTIIFLIRNS